jgi:regulator of protease activity HflC (stomatin/prohibitin superfamily)
LEGIKNATEPRGIVVEAVLLRNVELPKQLQDAIEAKLTAQQAIAQKEFDVQTAIKEAERKRQEAHGIADANAIISGSLSQNYLTWYWIQQLGLHNQTYYVPVGANGLPIFKSVE